MNLTDNIILNENAYFYKKKNPLKSKTKKKRPINQKKLSKAKIKKIFKEASSKKTGRWLLNKPKEFIRIDSKDIHYSICVFKCKTKPTFIEKEVEGWFEIKLAYLLIIEYSDYIMISKKNISESKELSDLLIPLDYKKLSRFMIDDNTFFEKFSLKNMNISDKAIRQKILEAINLQHSFSSLGARNYLLNNLRLSDGRDKFTLALNSSRINQFGSKDVIKELIEWSVFIADKINSYRGKDTYLDIFATPIDFESNIGNLKPKFILFFFNRLYDDFDNNRIEKFYYKLGANERELDLIKYLKKYERLRDVIEVPENDGTLKYIVDNTTDRNLELKLNKKSLTLSSKKFKNLFIRWTDKEETMLSYLNRANEFIVNFSDYRYIYFSRKLFQDNKLLGNLESTLSIFKPYPQLNSVSSEKGDFTDTSSSFCPDSIFGFVEKNFCDKVNYFFCDDLGNEWADHIGLSEDSIMFFHSKFGSEGLSASQLQDVIGQAQKNLGNVAPADDQLAQKLSKWGRKFAINNIVTEIERLRKGNNVTEGVEYYKELLSKPNTRKQVFLVVNFISKKRLTERLIDLKNGTDFPERNQVIQILWFISSLISTCIEAGVDIYICCSD